MIRLRQFKTSIANSAAGFAADERGATAIEYGLIVALISVAIMSIIFTMGSNIKTVLYGAIVTALQSM